MTVDQEVEDFLEHFGTKGMRWGVRRSADGHIKGGTAERVFREKSLSTKRGVVTKNVPDYYDESFTGRSAKALTKTYKAARGPINKGTKLLNNDPRFKGKDFKSDSPLRREYYKEFSKMAETQLNAAATLKGNSKRGEYRLNFSYDHEKSAYPEVTMKLNSNLSGRVEERAAAKATRKTVGGLKPTKPKTSAAHEDLIGMFLEHAIADDVEIKLNVVWDELGHIIELKDIPDDDVEHSDYYLNEAENFLNHSGVKGMKWGVRNSRPSSGARKPSSGKKPVKKPAAKPSSKADKKDSGKPDLSKMSNEELQRHINRINLESNYTKLTAKPAFKDQAKEMVKNVAKQAVQKKAQQLVDNAADIALRAAMNQILGSSATSALMPKKGKGDKKDD